MKINLKLIIVGVNVNVFKVIILSFEQIQQRKFMLLFFSIYTLSFF
jgi:hypothetical protein